MKLIFGAGGIYGSFLFYGIFQEAIFHFKAPDGTSFTHSRNENPSTKLMRMCFFTLGTQFKQTWFLQLLEAAANVFFGYIGLKVFGM